MRRFYIALLGGLAAVGCGGGSKSSGPPMITAVVISNDSTVALAGTRQLTATAMAGGSAISNGVTFQWSSTDTTRATVSGTGLVDGVRRGTTDITAQAVLNGTATGIVSPARTIRVRIAGIVVTPASPLPLNFKGETQSFAGEPRDAAGAAVPGLTISWSTSNAVLGISASGLATAGRTSSAGVVVRVRATTDGVTDSSVVILVRQVPVTATLNPNSFATLTAFGQQVSASCVVVDSANDTIPAQACSWASVPDTGVVSYNPLNAATTTITARKNGDANIRATAFAGVFAPNFVQVRQAPVRVKLHPTTIDTSRIVTTTGTMQFFDSVFDANDSLIRNPAPSITWSSSGAAASVDANGLITAGSSAGNTFIKAVSGTGKDSARIEVVTTGITLNGDVQPIFNANCASCHTGPTSGALPSGQNLTAGNSRANTVNIASIESGLKRILPSRPDSSYLVHKVQGTHLTRPASGSGVQMPPGGPFLTKAQINVIRNWILQGAP